MTDEKGLVEAALFSAGRPVTEEDVARSTGLGVAKVREHLESLASDYSGRSSAIEVAPVGGKWTMQIRLEFTDRARAFAPPEIERDLLKTAALIAYHQPVQQSDLGEMIGSKVYEHVQALTGLNLVNKRPRGRSFELTTTRYFVEFFGLKAEDREGIRKLLAEKAGVKFTPKPPPAGGESTDEAATPDAPTQEAPSAPSQTIAPGESITDG